MARKSKVKETIPAVEVGADVVEQAVQDNPELSKEFVEEALKATEEINGGEVTPYKAASEAIIDVLAEDDTQALPEAENVSSDNTEPLADVLDDEEDQSFSEYYIFDHADIPQPAVRIDLREVKLNSLVSKVLEIAYLGGELYPKGIQLGRVPYCVSMLIREDRYESYTMGAGFVPINDNALEVIVKGRDVASFLKRLIEVGKGGAVIQNQRQISKTGVYAAPLLTNTPVTASASISTGVKKPIYTVDDLKGFSAQQLKIVCNWYSLSYRGKVQARIDIVEKQKEIKSGER